MSIPPYLRKEHKRLIPQALASVASAKPGSWYDIRAAAGSPAEILIYDEIGGWGIMAADFVRDLQAITASEVNVHIASGGGSVFEALPMHASLRNLTAKVNVIVDGFCASAATVIAMAGDTITTAPGSMWMIHDAEVTAYGNAADMEAARELLDKHSQNMADIYAARAGGTADEWRAAMKAETWYTADEAVSAGLADGLTESAKQQVAAKAPALVAVGAPNVQTEAPLIDLVATFREAFNQKKEAVS